MPLDKVTIGDVLSPSHLSELHSHISKADALLANWIVSPENLDAITIKGKDFVLSIDEFLQWSLAYGDCRVTKDSCLLLSDVPTIGQIDYFSPRVAVLPSHCKAYHPCACSTVIDVRYGLCFTDSMVALYWIKGEDMERKQFIHNRVQEIRILVSASLWSHCPGTDNLADIPSLGHGPDWLLQMYSKKRSPCQLNAVLK